MRCCRCARMELVIGLVVWFGIAGFAAEPSRLAVAKSAPPTELSDAIRAMLQSEVIRLSEKDKPVYEFWFRKQVPVAEKPPADRLTLTTLKEGTLLGAVKIHAKRRDFKDLEIPPGVYVMRFGVQPEDGNHLGAAPTRTFALLIPAQEDREPEALAQHDALVKASSKMNQGEHPSALNLQPIQKTHTTFPNLAAHEDGKFKVLCLRLSGTLKDGQNPVPLTFSLVYEGKGQI